jgi:hypothetical protein
VNDVPSSFQVKTDAHKLATVIHTLLNTVMNHSESGSISISARKYHQVTLLHIKEKSRINTPDFAQRLIEVQTLAEDIGGSVSVTSYRNDVTTIALSVIDQAA